MADPDWTDPCAVLAWLRPLYFQVLTGGQEIRIRYGAERETFYGPGDVPQLQSLMRQLESECAAKNGSKIGRRRAFRFG